MTVADARAQMMNGGREPHARSVSFLALILCLLEPGGVTVPGKGPDEAQVVLDTGIDGRAHLPGTSLAGALRDMVRERRDRDTADDWFGRIVPGSDTTAQASRVWVLGSRRLDDADSQLLSSTRIDRSRGAAADNTLRTEEVLPAGSSFEVFLRWDDAADGEVEDLACMVASWRPLIGRGTSRGRGRCAVKVVRHGTLHLDDSDDLLRWLTLSGPELARNVATYLVTSVDEEVSADLLFRVPLTIKGPWHIGSGQKLGRGSREPIPLLRVGGRPVVPGSAVKGLLRSRAEFILRSVGLNPLPCDKVPCGNCWTCQVFGHGGGEDSGSAVVGRRAAIRLADAVISSPAETTRTHVAIDRFAGGVLDGALYTMEVLEGGSFAIEVDLLAADVDERRRAEIVAVLRLVLEDLNDGIIGMGASTARGYGSVSVNFGEVSGSLPTAADARQTLAQMVRGGA